MRDYRLNVRIRNNRILSCIEEAGYASAAEFCRKFRLNNQGVNALICMRDPALLKNGEWRPLVLDIAAALGMEAEDLFNERQARAEFKTTSIEQEIDEPLALADCSTQSDDGLLEAQCEFADAARRALGTMSARERLVITARFGLDGQPPMSLDECSMSGGVSRERIRQIEAKALRKSRAALGRTFPWAA
jgi:DNA-directed RNA polymerase sigma subunit (sigma70/sigma32)